MQTISCNDCRKFTQGVTVIAVTAIEPKSKQQQLEILHPMNVSIATLNPELDNPLLRFDQDRVMTREL